LSRCRAPEKLPKQELELFESRHLGLFKAGRVFKLPAGSRSAGKPRLLPGPRDRVHFLFGSFFLCEQRKRTFRIREDLLTLVYDIINPAIKYLKVVIPAKAGIQKNTGCRIKSGMTWLFYFVAGFIIN
jgi:hypothetical protein